MSEVEVTTTQETTAPVVESAAAPTTSDAVAPAAEGGIAPEVAPPYVPNLKYKAAGKEQEFPDWAKPLVKDPEMEKTLRELHERAYGLDAVKQERVALREQLSTAQTNYNDLVGHLKIAGDARKNGDWRTFFETLEVSDDDILKYALKVAELREAPPEIKQQYDDHWQASRRARELENEVGTLRGQLDSVGVTQRSMELHQALQRPGVAEVAAAYDERAGKPGAFMDQVISRGQLHWYQSQIDAPVEQVVSELVQMYGWVAQQNSSDVQQTPQVAQPSQAAATKKPVIPNINGRGTSPVKRVPGSIADLKKIRDEMMRG